ncbi:MAG TPA: hypothetical protein VGO70_03990 [Arsenicitalea sp.]|jgi:hypothetical protein|nr:hypothetical protein [Arsenicitalea sp.]
MCSLCGSLGQGPAWENEGAAADPAARRRGLQDARQAATELTRLLAAQRVRVTANPDFGYLVHLPTGGIETASGIADVWHTLTAAGIAVPDVLDI